MQTPPHWPWELISQIEYEPAARHVHETNWLVESTITELAGPAVGLPDGQQLSEADVERFRCAADALPG